MKSKQGQLTLDNVPVIVGILITIAVFISVGAMILGTIEEEVISGFSRTVTNETVTTGLANGSNYTLGEFGGHQDWSLTSVLITNVSAVLTENVNYTVEYDSVGTIFINNTDGMGGASWTTSSDTGLNFTYTYTATDQGAAYNATLEGLQGIQTLATWQTIIAIVIAAAIVIGLIGYLRR